MPLFYRLLRPALFLLGEETAHRAALAGMKLLAGRRPAADDPCLAVEAFGLRFSNPVGLAAGFDKNAEASAAAHALGFGFSEVGTVTPRPQAGNPPPRVFRLPKDRAIVNRLGFNNEGHEAVHARLAAARRRGAGPVGVNIGANRDSADPVADYVAGIVRFADLADFFTVNVSSPNTPGLRALQSREALADLLGRVLAARDAEPRRVPVLLKIAPDLTPGDRADIAELALASGLDGLVVSNTTISRPPGLDPRHAGQPGGLSGAPLFALSTELLAEMCRLTEGRLPLVGVGGVASGADAYAKIRAGGTLVELYTALVYEGPGLVRRITRDLAGFLERDGFTCLSEAVGADVRSASESAATAR